MYYVIKITIEDEQHTQTIMPFEQYRTALTYFHSEFAAATDYDTVKTCTELFIDDYGNEVEKTLHYERGKHTVATE